MSRAQQQQIFNKAEMQDAQNNYAQTQGDVTNFEEQLGKFAAAHPYVHIVRCTGTLSIAVHHKRRDGGTDIDNAQVLCSNCHYETSTYGTTGNSPPPFPQYVKDEALRISGY